MNKFGPKARDEIVRTMQLYKEGKLAIGTTDKKVKSKKQALAIGIESARRKHYKVPGNKKGDNNE